MAPPRLSALLVALGVLSFSTSCDSGPGDSLMVSIVDGTGGVLRVPDDLDAFEVRVSSVLGAGASERELVRLRRTYRLSRLGFADGDTVELPQTLTVVRAPGTSGTVRVEVFGLRAGRQVQHIRRTAAFGIGRVDLAPFSLTPFCFGVECDPGQTCEADGVCRAAPLVDAGVPDSSGPCPALQVACGDTCVPFGETNCETCGNSCGLDGRCIANRCTCEEGFTACGGVCVDTLRDTSHCGACDSRCTSTSGVPLCEEGICELDCPLGTGSCDGNTSNGCETDTTTTANCGGCGNVCTGPLGDAECVANRCTSLTCAPGSADCDGLRPTGCEINLTDDIDNCGVCGVSCDFPNAVERCQSSACEILSCASGWGDCDGLVANGCERAVSCVAGSRCTASCGTSGTISCANACAPTCMAPAEVCNAIDDDCDGRCDELGGCRSSAFRASTGALHCIGKDTVTADCPAGYVLEFGNYFYLYSTPQPSLAALHRCTTLGGRTFLSLSATCDGVGVWDFTLGYVATSADVCGSTPLYYHLNSTTGDRHYTVDAAARDAAISAGWPLVRILGYVWLSSSG